MKQTLLDTTVKSIIRVDWEKVIFIAIILVALVTRLWGLGDRVQSHDESIHTRYSWNLYVGHGFSHSPLMHGPFLFHATALSYFLFSDNDYTARLPVALLGVALVAIPWLFRRWLGQVGALVTSFFLLISPSIAYYSRYIRHDIPIMVWALLVLWAVFSYLDDGRERWLYVMAGGVSLMFATKEVAFIYNAILGLFLVGLFAAQAAESVWTRELYARLRPLLVAGLAALAIGLLILGLGVLLTPDEQAIPVWWAVSGAVLAGISLLAVLGLLLAGTWHDLRSYRVFDLIVILGTLCLPFLSPILIQLAGFSPVDYSSSTLVYSGAIAGVVFLVSAAVGLVWDWRRWGIAAAIHYAIFAVLFTTVFTNGTGIASGLVGSLGYWLAQQAVERGSQPWYYYTITVLLYEYLPLLLTVIGYLYLIIGKALVRRSAPGDPKFGGSRSRFLPFLLWWIPATWICYSYAGEKMPWLTVHVALPMIFLSGWLVGRFLEAINWQLVFQRRAWLLLFVAPPLAAALVMSARAVSAGPFQGYELAQLSTTGRLLSGVLGVLGFGAGMGYLIRRTGWRIAGHTLFLTILLLPLFLTVRTAWRFCYVNYDLPIEHLVYAHAAPAVNETMRQIDTLSRRTAGGSNLIKVAYGSDGSTLWYWQLRNYPNAAFYGDSPSREQLDAPVVIAGRDEWEEVAPYMDRDYVVNTYTYLWWPMEDYRNLSWTRVTRAITDTQTRAALWDIWYDRDYGRYDEVTGEKHTLDAWPLRSDYRLYIRRDVISQLWEVGTTEPVEIGPSDPYAEGWEPLTARLVFGSQGSGSGQFERSNGIEIGPDGYVYVADTGNHRVQKFTAEGEFVAAWGRNSVIEAETGSPQGFNEPWDVAVAPDGSVFVADTWNHRIQKLDGLGQPVFAWGLFGQYGVGDAGGQSAFYGPRGIAVGPDGRVYVSDTGNKRVQVFESGGQFAYQWGGGGVLEGYLDEPVGIAFAPEDAPLSAVGVYVADTWNRRVQVFDTSGSYLREWPINGWDTGLSEEKPYLAVDSKGYVYVTDPGHYRVLVFDYAGNYMLSFGQYGLDAQSFALPTGVAVAEDGSIYVVDSHGARILVFDSLGLERLDPDVP
jgi:predicted membrane-bound mannosyltransferase/DNA-binding beta-propeller fold protein YncE